ncbi:MAG: DUF6273 domain-containing protein, partial [Lachnospiraceae bacterium]|nr:DUF6273 domain-containing protein [Lachnospiraceae bacterium]
IAETTLLNSDNPEYGTAGGNSTADKIFLLSLDEVSKYYKSDEERVAYYNGSISWWLLRSPGYYSYFSSEVYFDGSVGIFGRDVLCVHRIRPALWLNQ